MIRSRPRLLMLWFVIAVVALTAFGVLMVYSASSVTAFRLYGTEHYFLSRTAFFAVIGLLSFFFFSNTDYRKWQPYTAWLLWITLAMLVVVLVLGDPVNGARRWIDIGITNFQPTELAKLSVTAYLAGWLACLPDKKERKTDEIWHFLGLCGVLSVLIMLQPDFGTLVVILIAAISVFFVHGMKFSHVLILLVCGAILAAYAFSSPFRRERLAVFFAGNNSETVQISDEKYQVNNLEIAFASGGLWGSGFNESKQVRGFLPEPFTDSIFAVIVEELGVIIGVIVIVLLAFLSLRSFHIASHAPDLFGRYWAAGIGTWISFQTLFNLAAILQLVPLKGIPLPLISYGGTSLIITLSALGILVSIAKARSMNGEVERVRLPRKRELRRAS